MMGERRRRDAEFRADLSDYHPLRMRGQQQPNDAQARLRAEGGEHVGIADQFGVGIRGIHVDLILILP